MKVEKYRNQLNDIRKNIIDDIKKIFEKYQENGELSTVREGEDIDEGISLDYVKDRDDYYVDDIICIVEGREVYTEDNRVFDLWDFNAEELLRFYEELLDIYEP